MKLLLSLIAFSGLCTTAFAQTNSGPLPSKEKLHIYLLMGQSNMAGRGAIGKEDKTAHPRVLMLTTNNSWEPAIEPITKDRASRLGVGPGLKFGKIMAEKSPGATIALVPCAVGGTLLKRWERGGDLYERAVARAKSAMADGTLKGIVWHQGENDSIVEADAKSYGERLVRMIGDIRKDLEAPQLPFVAGQIGEFLYNRKEKDKTPFARLVNDALANLPKVVPMTACVKSNGLGHTGDEVHFDTAAQHEFGKRYATEMIRLQASVE